MIPWDVNYLPGLCYLTGIHKYEVTSPLAKLPRHISTVPFLKETQSMQSWFPGLSMFICQARVILWLLSFSWLQQALAPALTSTSSPLGFSLNHFTTQVRPMWSPDCTTPYNPDPGSSELLVTMVGKKTDKSGKGAQTFLSDWDCQLLGSHGWSLPLVNGMRKNTSSYTVKIVAKLEWWSWSWGVTLVSTDYV